MRSGVGGAGGVLAGTMNVASTTAVPVPVFLASPGESDDSTNVSPGW
jgi:hypothetical protein